MYITWPICTVVDVVIGAPFAEDGKGVIYVYNGYTHGFMETQKILGSDLDLRLRSTFGGALSQNAMDVNGDSYMGMVIYLFFSCFCSWHEKMKGAVIHQSICIFMLWFSDYNQPFLVHLSRSGVSNLSHCRTFVRQTGRKVRQTIFKYDPYFWQFEEKITEVSQNLRCREIKTPVPSSPNGPLLINTPSYQNTIL